VLVFDYFHVVQLATRALDEVRRRERREFPQQLLGARWELLKPQSQLTAEQQQTTTLPLPSTATALGAS